MEKREIKSNELNSNDQRPQLLSVWKICFGHFFSIFLSTSKGPSFVNYSTYKHQKLYSKYRAARCTEMTQWWAQMQRMQKEKPFLNIYKKNAKEEKNKTFFYLYYLHEWIEIGFCFVMIHRWFVWFFFLLFDFSFSPVDFPFIYFFFFGNRHGLYFWFMIFQKAKNKSKIIVIAKWVLWWSKKNTMSLCGTALSKNKMWKNVKNRKKSCREWHFTANIGFTPQNFSSNICGEMSFTTTLFLKPYKSFLRV